MSKIDFVESQWKTKIQLETDLEKVINTKDKALNEIEKLTAKIELFNTQIISVEQSISRYYENEDNIKYPYTHGLFCADGTYHMSYDKNSKFPGIALYGEKKNLINHIEVRTSSFKEDSAFTTSRLFPKPSLNFLFVTSTTCWAKSIFFF